MLKREEEGVLAVEEEKEKEGVDYHTFIKIEFILENLKQKKELFQKI